MGIAHDALGVEDEHAASREPDRAQGAVQPGHGLVGVGEEREREPVLAGEGVVAADVLCGDADDLGIHVAELLEIVVVGVELLRAHRGVVTRVEHEHDALARNSDSEYSRPPVPGRVKSGA